MRVRARGERVVRWFDGGDAIEERTYVREVKYFVSEVGKGRNVYGGYLNLGRC